MPDQKYIDPSGYWIDPSRNVRRMGVEDGEQRVILRATQDCSEAEWTMLYEAIVKCISTTRDPRTETQVEELPTLVEASTGKAQ